MASAALSRRAAGSRCGCRGRQPALRRPRAADAGPRGRARQRGPVRGRLVRDLRGVGRRARRARRRALARRGPEGGGRGPAGGAPGGHSPHADALRDAPALGARDRAERQAMRLDELTRPDFPILERVANGHPLVYLDSAASSQRPRTVIEAMSQYYARSHANVHRSIHTLGEEATELYEAARDRVQRFIGAGSREEVVFTRGTTDGLSLLAETLGRTLRAGDEVLITDRKSTRLNSSHGYISYAVFCLKKKKNTIETRATTRRAHVSMLSTAPWRRAATASADKAAIPSTPIACCSQLRTGQLCQHVDAQ